MPNCERQLHIVPSPFAVLLISKPPEQRAAILKRQREALGVAQSVLAAAAQLSRRTVWLAETSGRVCARSLIAIAHALEDIEDQDGAALARCRHRSTDGAGRQG